MKTASYLPSPSPGLLRTLLDEVLERRDTPPPVAFRCGGWSGPERLEVRGKTCWIHWCASVLEMRDRLLEPPVEGEVLVLLANRPDEALGPDLLCRLLRRRLLDIDPWKALRQAFGASRLDPRLAHEPWLAEALLDSQPAGGYPPVPTSSLDLDSAWRAFLEAHLALGDGATDPMSLLRWSLGNGGPEQLRQLAPPRVEKVLDYLHRRGGNTSAAIARLAYHGREGDALALGLVCRALFSGLPAEEVRRAAAGARLEGLLDGHKLDRTEGRLWAETAEAIAEGWQRGTTPRPLLARTLRLADELLKTLELEPLAYHSRWLSSGYTQRADRLATALRQSLASTPAAADGPLVSLAERVAEHHRARRPGPDGASVLAMVGRLLRWLSRREAEPLEMPSLEVAVRLYGSELSFVDFAREALWRHAPEPPLSDSVALLLERVATLREDFNRRFGELVRGWFEADGDTPGILPVEAVINRCLVPLAEQGPTLFLIVDGMSFAIYHELLGDLLNRGWEPLVHGKDPLPQAALATLPSVTAASRTALLCGQLVEGAGQGVEARGFAGHQGLLPHCKTGKPPRLFHKGDLRGDAGGLAREVRQCLADEGRRAVAVVLNAVDDQLGRGDQLTPRWSVETLGPLEAILDAAGEAGRTVVLTADHGHLAEQHPGRVKLGGEGPMGERHRLVGPTAGSTDDGELLVKGRRVRTAEGKVIVPWSETSRYGPRKAGYHGGSTPQELLIPLVVLAPEGRAPEGWTHARGDLPAWWEPGRAEKVPEPRSPSSAVEHRRGGRKPPPSIASPAQGVLFEPPPASAPDDAEARDGGRWALLFESSAWHSQVELCGGPAFAPLRRVADVLDLVDRHGGRISLTAAGRALALGLPRLRSLIAQLQRLLNIEGYPVLDLDDASAELRLDHALLSQQFELER